MMLVVFDVILTVATVLAVGCLVYEYLDSR